MADEHLRRLERDAERGDPEAAARLARERDRRGLSIRWQVAATWPLGEGERATDVLFTQGGGDLLLALESEVRILDPATGDVRGKAEPGLLRRVGPIAVDATRLYVGEVSGVRAESAPPGPFTIGHQVLAHLLPGLLVDPPLAELGGDVTALAANGGVVLAACGDAVHSFCSEGAQRKNPWLRGRAARALALSRDGTKALVVTDAHASVRSVAGGPSTVRLDPGEPLVATGALTEDGAHAVLATSDGVQVWDAAPGVRLLHLRCPEPPVRSVSIGGGNADVIVAAAADRVFAWHLPSGLELGCSDSLGLPVTRAVLDPTGRLLAALNPTRLWLLEAA